MKTYRPLGILFVLAGAAGCAAAVPPPELTSARKLYNTSSNGPTAQLDPADLHTAKGSLDLAEQSFSEKGDTQQTRDLAYTAGRRVEVADARARAMQAQADKDQAVAQMNAATAEQARRSAEELARARQTMASQGQALASQGAALQNERERREAAEKRAAQAAADLAKFASVKQETRGMVITLSGSVLFASGKSDLLPEAKIRLNQVADALTQQDRDSKIVVEGHTDSQGTAALNDELSQKRAQSVRDYLVTRGIAEDRISAQGFGSTRAIADNKTAEGRANNRRVEIVVQPTAGATNAPSKPPSP